jgi:enamine deaminase RidA (YjgF/YER057c/UK114 family)
VQRLISFGFDMETPFDYSCPVVDGEWVFVVGTTGFDYATGVIFDKPAEQKLQTFCNIEAAQVEADATLSNVVRAPYIATNSEQLETIAEFVGENFHKIRPSAKAIISNYVDQRMKIVIEGTTRKRGET